MSAYWIIHRNFPEKFYIRYYYKPDTAPAKLIGEGPHYHGFGCYEDAEQYLEKYFHNPWNHSILRIQLISANELNNPIKKGA